MKNPNCVFMRASKFLTHELAAFSLVLFAAASLRADTPIQTENAKLGTSAWQLTNPATNREIEGYASLTSVNRGQQISLYVNTSAATYTIEIYRMGWYAGDGGRLMMSPITRNGVQQVIPSPTVDGLIDCNWVDPYVLSIPNISDPSDWASGVYLAKLTAAGTGRQSYIIFVVRDDARPSDYLFQSSVTTFQAYNLWGGASLYNWAGGRGRAVKVSFNRPYSLGAQASSASGVGAGEFLTNVQPPASTVAAGWNTTWFGGLNVKVWM